MPGRDLVIAAVLAALLHCSVALVSAPALQKPSLSEDKTFEISIISEYKRNLEITEVAAHETKQEESQKTYDREKVTVKKKVGKRAAVTAEERESVAIPSKGASVETYKIAPTLQAAADIGKLAERIVTEPVMPYYRGNSPPKYPEFARRRGYEGEVLLTVTVAVDGTVAALKVKDPSGHPILDQAAMKAVAAWEFEPARLMGVPVPLSVDIPVRFVLRRP